MIDEPEKETEREADNKASDDWKVKRGVFAAMNDVARKAAKTERNFAAEEEKCPDEQECRS